MDKSTGPGWDKIVDPLIERCEREGIEIFQIKQKYGYLRFYVDSSDPDIYAAIDQAELESTRTCEECGEPGHCRTVDGWMMTMCDTCADEFVKSKRKLYATSN